MKIKQSLFIFTLIIGSLGSSFSASAANVWKDCGIGHWIAGPTWKGYPAITTNLIWDLGTTATSSDVTTPQFCAGPFWAAAKFINSTYPMLEEDTAQGEGQHLIAMLDILQCDSDVRPTMINNIRAGYAQQANQADFQNQKHVEKAEAYYNIVTEQASKYCSAA